MDNPKGSNPKRQGVFSPCAKTLARHNGEYRPKPQSIFLRRGQTWDNRRNTLAVSMGIDTAQNLVNHYLAWCEQVKLTPRRYISIMRVRGRKKPMSVIGVCLETAQVDAVNVLCGHYEDDDGGFVSVNYVNAWCIKTGCKQLTAEKLMKRWPDIRPTLSSVAALAFELGLRHFHKYHNKRGTCV